jgi:hypothetical protein
VHPNGSEWENDWNISAWANLTRGMKRLGVGNGFDPLGGDLEDIANASKLGWPVSLYPLHGGNLCFQVPTCVNNMTASEYGWLRPLDDANVYTEVQFGEYGARRLEATCGPPSPLPR